MNRPLLRTAALALTAITSHAAPDPGALIRDLAQPPPATIAFAEVRFSPLLEEPLIVAGELGYAGPQELQRRVRHPYQELTSIRGESVRVERSGQAPRTFALKRAPELRGLLTGFAALLAGDVTAIEKEFELQITGERTQWQLQLVPKAASVQRRLERLVIDGHERQPRCFTMIASGGSTSVMLLGTLAATAFAKPPSLSDLQHLCTNGPAGP
jgi:hypothetical protein